MFSDNKYRLWYYGITNNAQARTLPNDTIVEKHHIIPKCMGGENTTDNIAKLTPREHFVCHWLLTKIVTEPSAKQKMFLALGKFVQNGRGQNRILTSKQYDIARTAISKARKGIKRSTKTRRKISEGLRGNIPWNKGKIGVQSHTEETRKKIANARTGHTHTDETKANMSAAKKGHRAGMTGKKHTKESKLKISASMKGARGPQKRIKNCPTCDANHVTHRHIKFCKEKIKC